MNIMFCGDSGIESGVLLSTLSILKHVSAPLHFYILTLDCKTEEKHYMPLSNSFAEMLDSIVKEKNPSSFVKLFDLTSAFESEIPEANMSTSFTPPCMLRLFADDVKDLPDKILYLDTDVMCRGDFSDFYNRDISEYELVGVLDYYGQWFFGRAPFKHDYLNSGVLLLNMQMIRKTKLFRHAREMCRTKKMFMPDQSALNKLAVAKGFAERKFNEQRRMKNDTIFRHFTTHFALFPVFHAVKVKPWEVEKLHKTLKIYEFDDILKESELLLQNTKGVH